jgi:CRP/FNR family transcriptional regulator, anaerobic regulatory protein
MKARENMNASAGDPREDVIEGDHQLRAAFRAGLTGSCDPGTVLLAAGGKKDRVYQLRTGLAYCAHDVAEGRRAIVDLYVPGDIIGIEAVIDRRPAAAVVVASPLRFCSLETPAIQQMMQESRAVSLRVAGILFEAQQRAGRLAAKIARLDAPERVAYMLIDLHERMLRTGLIHRDTFNLRLTQQQIGDHLGLSGVHVNRVLRWLAREQIAFIEHHVVIIKDKPRLRALARGEMPAERQMARRPTVRRQVAVAPLDTDSA